MALKDIVNVTVTKESARISQAGFGLPLIVGSSNRLDVIDSDKIYFDSAFVTGNEITVYINGVALSPVTYATSSDATLTAIASTIQGNINVSTAVASTADKKITVTGAADSKAQITDIIITGGATQPKVTISYYPATRIAFYSTLQGMVDDGFLTTDPEYRAAAVMFSQSPASPERIAIGAERTGDASMTDTLNAIVLENNDWYGMMITSRSAADQEAAAAWALANKKVSCFATNNVSAYSTATTDLGAKLKAISNDRALVVWHETADGSLIDQWPDAAVLGTQLPTIPGSTIVAFNTLEGVSASSLTETQKLNLLGKNYNIIEEIAGVTVIRSGAMASGEFFDVTRGLDWLQARIAEGIWGLLIRKSNANSKVPFTEAGGVMIESEIRSVMSQGITNGLIANDPAPVITIPNILGIPAAEKEARILNGVTFTATLQGAIQKVVINGTISF